MSTELRIEKPAGGDEFDRYVEAAVAQERRHWEWREDAHAAEKAQLREENARLREILGGIAALLPPGRTEHEGRVYEFQDPDANRTLRALRDRIWAIIGSVAAIRNAKLASTPPPEATP